jgi:hypothetical protein
MCRCSRWLAIDANSLGEPDPDFFTDPHLPWRCDGHPPITRPHELDGARIDTRAQLRALVDRGFHGEGPPRTREADRTYARWLVRLHAKLLPAEASIVVAAAVAALEAPDPRARGLALEFFDFVPDDDARTRLLELVQHRPELFVGLLYNNNPDVTMEDKSWRVIGPLVGKPVAAQTLARSAAQAGRANRGMLNALAEHDSAWLIAHLEHIAHAAPGRAVDLEDCLMHLPQHLKGPANRVRIRAALRVEEEPLDALRAACKDIVQRSTREIPLKGSITPVRYALPALRSGAQLELEVGDLADLTRSGTLADGDRYLALRVNGKRVGRWLRRGDKLSLKAFLEEETAPVRIAYLARGNDA